MGRNSFIGKLREITHYEELKDERGIPYQIRIHYDIIGLFALPWFYGLPRNAQKELCIGTLNNLILSIEQAKREIKEL